MKLPICNLTTEQLLSEFDTWITPSTGEIQDTSKFRAELALIDKLICSIGNATNEFRLEDDCNPEKIANTCIGLIETAIAAEESYSNKILVCEEIINSLCALLFMVTGKSDNNLKCQFPVFLTQEVKKNTFPQLGRSAGRPAFEIKPLGRTIKSERISSLIASALIHYSESGKDQYLEVEAKWLLGKYISAILVDRKSVTQLWALGHSYFHLRKLGNGSEKALLAPIVIFKVRGSVAASGGHIPESILRSMMRDWGLHEGVDFNTEDVIISAKVGKDKTRAYDFVLPYKSAGWSHQLFIQCQFYAGDSGSVSHKVVDQTQASRPSTLALFPTAKFIEYLDGAGYYSSLNSDLTHMVSMASTKALIQIRTAHIKLRRELQEIGFLTPLEIEHAVLRVKSSTVENIRQLLEADGYAGNEIDRCLQDALKRDVIRLISGEIVISPARLDFVRRIILMDIVANSGQPDRKTKGSTLLIPGYGDQFGIELDALSKSIDVYLPFYNFSRNDFSSDVAWLSQHRFILIA